MLPFAESMFTVSFLLSKFDFGSGLITVNGIPSPEAIKILAYFFLLLTQIASLETRLKSSPFLFFRK